MIPRLLELLWQESLPERLNMMERWSVIKKSYPLPIPLGVSWEVKVLVMILMYRSNLIKTFLKGFIPMWRWRRNKPIFEMLHHDALSPARFCSYFQIHFFGASFLILLYLTNTLPHRYFYLASESSKKAPLKIAVLVLFLENYNKKIIWKVEGNQPQTSIFGNSGTYFSFRDDDIIKWCNW